MSHPGERFRIWVDNHMVSESNIQTVMNISMATRS